MKNNLFYALTAAALLFMPKVVFGQAPNLGTAANFVLFTTVGAVTNSGIPYLTHLTGNVGSNSGSSTGFGNVDGRMLDGGIESAAAATDLGIAYLALDGAIPTFFPSSLLGGGATLVPGVYYIPSAATMNGVLNLDAGGDPNAVFIFQIEGAFATGSGAKVHLLNGALACNVFWKVEGMVSLASSTTMRGTIVAHNDAISIGVGDTLEGRALSINGAITTNAILAYTPIGCGSPILTGSAAPPLGAAAIFGVFAGIGSVTATPITYVNGDVGSNSAGATGFDPLNVTGTIHPAPDAATAAAAADLIIAYNFLNATTTEIDLLYPALFGHDLVLTPHVYNLAGSPTTLTGSVFLNAQGNPNAVFIIKMSGAFITSTLSRIILVNGAKAENVYWKIDGAVNIFANSFFNGTIVGAGAITLNTGDTLNGRALTINGAVAINGSYIEPQPAPCQASDITGTMQVCVGGTTLLSNVDTGGMWYSTDTAVATVDTTTGLVTGVSAGTVIISFRSGLHCEVTDTVLVNTAPAAITGSDTVCTGDTVMLSNITTGGTWTSSDTAIATVATTSGVVTGIAAGQATISYTTTGACSSFMTINVSPTPFAGNITGISPLCPTDTASMHSDTTGGFWFSGNTSVASIDSVTGLVTALMSGTTVISYTVTNSCGVAAATSVVTVSALPSAGTISGTATVCPAATTTLTSTFSGGRWASSDTAIASVDSLSGVVTGVLAGTATISYTVTNTCGTATTTVAVTVSTLTSAGALSGVASVCPATSSTLSSTVTGGVWTSTNLTVATIGSSSGIVTGLVLGTSTISYTVTGSCGTASATIVVTVNTVPVTGTITGTTTVCVSATTTLANTVTGGVWSSVTAGVATVGSLSGIVSGIAPGTSTISYTVTNSCGTAAATQVVTVNPLPNAGTISGTALVCAGNITTLSSTATGGVWSSANTAVATVGTSGVVSGISAGTSAISYSSTNSCGTDIASLIVTVSPLPVAGPVSGVLVVCTSATTSLGNSTTGGVWTSSDISVASIGSASGIATGVTTGTVAISYTVTNSCGTAAVGAVLTVNPVPVAGTITGLASICPATTSTLSSTVASGEWASSNTTVATVGSSSGIVTGLILGTSTISYTVSNSCGAATATVVVTVDVVPNAGAITGITTLCPAATTTLSNIVSGGVWSSVTTAIATIGATSGIVSGVAAGTSLMSYTVTNSCGTAAATIIVTVSPLPDAGINTGTATVCPAATTTISNAVSGGTWSSTNTAVATVGSASGIVSGVAPGTSVVSYTVINSCGTAAATTVVTVSSLPDAGTVTGIAFICATANTNFSSTVTGGVWSSANPTVASVGSATGLVSGLAAGTSTIIYTVTNSCGTASDSRVVTVNPLPVAGTISGANSVCVGSTVTLASTEAGGVWSSSSANATVTSTGVVTGIIAGSSVITYSAVNSCGTAFDTHLVAVNPLPNAGVISGPSAVCVGDVIILTNTATTGTWSSSNSTANVSGGMVIGVLPGIDTIIYSVFNVCGSASVIKIINVNILPAMPVVTTQSPAALCVGTMYQNFGTSVPAATGTEYNWTAVNAGVWAQGAFSNYALVNFNVIDTAFVTLTATISATGCSSAATTAVNVGASPAHTDYVSYFNMHFVCTPADNSTYQWGYDDAYTLDSVILKGEINQDYVNTNPDLSNKYYWVMTTRNGCLQKTYYRAPVTVQTINEEAVSVTVFPNPASSIVNISISNVTSGKIVVEISNMLGQEIAATDAIDGKATLDVATLPAGAYMVSCFQNGVRISASRITKN